MTDGDSTKLSEDAVEPRNQCQVLEPENNILKLRGNLMAAINAYIPAITPLMVETEEGKRSASGCIKFGGWNHDDKTLTPIHVEALLAMPYNPALFWVMDSLAAAAEAGRLDADRYIDQLFASRGDARAFRLIKS